MTATSDATGLSGSDSAEVEISNVAPIVTIDPDSITVTVGGVTGSFSFSDPGADSWIADIDYSDSEDPLPRDVPLSGKSGKFDHQYECTGTYTITVRVFDDVTFGDDSLTLSVEAADCDPAPPIDPVPPGELVPPDDPLLPDDPVD